MCVWGEVNKERVLCALRGTVDTVAKLPDPLKMLSEAFVCPDKACSWESREAWGPHLLRFHL